MENFNKSFRNWKVSEIGFLKPVKFGKPDPKLNQLKLMFYELMKISSLLGTYWRFIWNPLETHQRPTCLIGGPLGTYMFYHISDQHAQLETNIKYVYENKYAYTSIGVSRHTCVSDGSSQACISLWLVSDQECLSPIRYVHLPSGKLVFNQACWSLKGHVGLWL